MLANNATDGLKEDTVMSKVPKQEQRLRLITWLKAVFTLDTYQNATKIRLNDTGNWIFERTSYRLWALSKNSEKAVSKFLWVHGGPGFGKTILCAKILESLALDKSRKLASFFCSSEHEERREPSALLCSWIAQLIQSDDTALTIIFELYKANMTRPPTPEELWKILRLISTLLPCTLVVDGFDECSTVSPASKYNTREGRSQFLQSLIGAMHDTGARVLLVSRDHEDIRSVLNGLSKSADPIFFEHAVSKEDTEPDVLLCSKSIMNAKLADRADEVKDEMATEAAEKSAGMFLCLDLLGQEMSSGESTQSLRRIVSEMPTGLEKAYERELTRILELKGHRREQALAVLRWILFAQKPLSVRELAEALILTSNETEAYPFEALPTTWNTQYVDEHYVNAAIIKYCGSLVELRKSGDDDNLALKTVHFVHASVRDYLLTSHGERGPVDVGLLDKLTENDHLAQLCLRYLCYGVFNEADISKIKKRIKRFPFLFYATKSWFNHARLRGEVSHNLEPSIEKLFDPKNKNWVLWSDIFEGQLVLTEEDEVEEQSEAQEDFKGTVPGPSTVHDEWDDPSYADSDEETMNTRGLNEADPSISITSIRSTQQHAGAQESVQSPAAGPSPLYYAALLGLTNAVKSLRVQGLDCNTMGGKFGSPLQAAIEGGYLDTVDHLLEIGVDINISGGYYGSALGAAASHGFKPLVERLLSMGARTETSNEAGFNCLHFACQSRETEVAKILLEKDKDLIKSTSKLGVSPFSYAVGSGQLELVVLLRRAGANVNDKDEDGFPVLAAAVFYGHQEIALDLVRHRADVNARNKVGASPLHLAAFRGDEKLTRLLVSHQADLDAVNENQFNLIHFACAGQSTAVVKYLIEKGAPVDLADKDGWKPLHVAAELPNLEIIQVLLDRGVNIDDTSQCYETPLMSALFKKQFESAKLLIQRGADTSMTGVTGDIALDIAFDTGDQHIIALLLQKGGFHEFGAEFNSEMQLPTDLATLDLPIAAHRSTVDHQEDAFLTRLKGLDLDHTSSKALDAALLVSVSLNSLPLVQGLLDKGADPSCRTLHRRTPLHIAARQGFDAILEVLLENGASAIARDTVGSTPLHVAAWQGQLRLKIIESLLARGSLFNGYGGDSKPVAPHADIMEKLTGSWEGKYAHSSWYMGFEAETNVGMYYKRELSSDMWHLPWFRYEGKDYLGEFIMIGYAYGPGIVRCVKLMEDFGRYCEVILKEGKEGEPDSIRGKWGENDERWHGTIDMKKVKAGEEGKILGHAAKEDTLRQ